MKVADASDQPKRRKIITVSDQHGRKWEVTVDKESFVHCTPPIPRFRAPLMPPLEYVTSNPDRPGRVRIDYHGWESERMAANRLWDERELELRRVEHDPVSRAALIGIRPEAPEFVRAARMGESKWILGIRKPDGSEYPVPTWAKEIGMDRLAPRPTIARDFSLERAALKNRYRDEDEDGTPITASAETTPPEPDPEDETADEDAWLHPFGEADEDDETDEDGLADFDDDEVTGDDDDFDDAASAPPTPAVASAATSPAKPVKPAKSAKRRQEG